MARSTQAPTINALRLIYYALVLGIVLFSVVIIAMPLDGREGKPETTPEEGLGVVEILVLIAGALTVVPGFAARFIGRTLAVRSMVGSSDTMQGYAAGKILGAALAEGPGLFWCVIAFRVNEPMYLIGAAVCVLLILTQLPSEEELADLTRLASERTTIEEMR